MSTSTGFNEAAPPPPPKKKRGCLIAVVIVLLLLLGGCVTLAIFGQRMAGWAADKGIAAMEAQATSALAEDVPSDLRAEFKDAIGRYRTFMVDLTGGHVKPKKPEMVGKPMEQLGTAMQDKSITVDEATRFVELVNEALSAAESE